jgi:diaminopimelate decarboxylase
MIELGLAAELVARYGSPLYVYDLEQVDRRASELRTLLPAGAPLFYSLKANPHPTVARALATAGLRAEVSSPGELDVAVEAGFAPKEMLYTGPAKNEAEVLHAATWGVDCFSCESERDLVRVAAVAERSGSRVRVLLRLNPPGEAGYGLAMSGTATQFGMDMDALCRCIDQYLERSWAVIRGVHVYYGSQARDAAALARNARAVMTLVRALDETLPPWLDVVDLGGGFPWPHGVQGSPPDLHGLREELGQAVAAVPARAECWFESGRYLTASAGTLVATVMDVKESRGRTFVLLDAGINHLGGMAGLGRVHVPALDVVPLERGSDGGGMATVTGPLCSPLDVLSRDCPTAGLRPGNQVAIPNVGAYGATASLTGFLSRPPAAEVAHRGGRVCGAYRLRQGHEQMA